MSSSNTRYYSAIPLPAPEPEALHRSVEALKNNVEVLTQQKSPKSASAVTWQDLVDLGFISPLKIPL